MKVLIVKVSFTGAFIIIFSGVLWYERMPCYVVSVEKNPSTLLFSLFQFSAGVGGEKRSDLGPCLLRIMICKLDNCNTTPTLCLLLKSAVLGLTTLLTTSVGTLLLWQPLDSSLKSGTRLSLL